MKSTTSVAFLLALFAVPNLSCAQSDEDTTGVLTVQCNYSDYETSQDETVLIKTTRHNGGDAASTKIFQRGEKSQNVTYLVSPGEVVECVFPSGNRVRAKVGEGEARGYGWCGGNPEVFGSIWVNERKIVSRFWFAGHCIEEHGDSDVSFAFNSPSMSGKKCVSERPTEANASGSDSDSKSDSKEPLSVCEDLPEISRFPRDEVEYPRPGQKRSIAGDVELLTGSHKICKAALEELKADFNTLGRNPNRVTVNLRRPDWNIPPEELPVDSDYLSGIGSFFDFDNDGKLDRVVKYDRQDNFIDGSMLLVQRGKSATKLNVSGSSMDKSIPCRMSAAQREIRDCSLPFSQKNSEAGFWMKAGGKKDVIYFRARYLVIEPFTFGGESFIGVSSRSEDTKDFVAVLKPMPNRTYQPMCLFKRVPENF